MTKDKRTIKRITADKGERNQGPGKGNKEFADATLPVAQWRGQIDLGGAEIDCYVLPDGTRLLASTSAAMAISEVDRANLKDYAGQKTLNPFIDINKILNETRSFAIPGTQWPASGITTEHFELICRGYVQALYEKAPLTDRQREIAIRCAVLTAGLTRTGIDALVDEATGYQYERASDALAIKLRAFIAVELREWEKTFPDELWQEFGRLTNWKGPLHSRPRWWGKLVIELIYDTLDPLRLESKICFRNSAVKDRRSSKNNAVSSISIVAAILFTTSLETQRDFLKTFYRHSCLYFEPILLNSFCSSYV